ncbi:uncharacterized protein [Apostichopus japonicus]|uniref:uncharacterized protein n=1 Tax=Stichopus japonicus TaxID=307972 RepID=UPI003AB398B3
MATELLNYPENYVGSSGKPFHKLPRIRSKTWDGTVPMQTDSCGIPFGSGLHRAVLENRAHQVRLLISFGMNIDKRDSAGRTPAMLTAWLESDTLSVRILRMLIKGNADLNMKDYNGRSLLSHACLQGRTSLVHRLLREDTLEKNCPDVNGDSPLNLAATTGHAEIVAMLVMALKRDGLNADMRNRQGCTALLLATQNGHYRCAQILLDDGRASLSSRDNKHFMNPTDWARHSHHEHQQQIKQRLSLVFGRGDIQQLNVPGKLPQLGNLPRKYIPPYHSIAQEMNTISELREQQSSLMQLIDSFETKESDDPDVSNGTLSRTLSASSTVHTSDDMETCLLEDPKMSTTPITSNLANIFKLYEQQMFIRRAQPIPEAEEPDMQEETKKAPRAAAIMRRQSTINLMSLVMGKKKNMLQMMADK